MTMTMTIKDLIFLFDNPKVSRVRDSENYPNEFIQMFFTRTELQAAIKCLKNAQELEEFVEEAYGEDLWENMIQWREEKSDSGS